jgi:ketosteroid isomerase-like protein
MPSPNVLTVERIYEAFRKRDLPTIFALCAEDVEIRQSTEMPWGGTYQGHDGLGQFFAALARHLDTTVDIDRFIDAGDSLVALGRTHGTARATGSSFDVPVAHVWSLENGRATRFHAYIDHPTMLPALPALPVNQG